MSDENEYYAYSSEDEDDDAFMNDDEKYNQDDDTSLDPDEKEAMALENPNAAPVKSSFSGASSSAFVFFSRIFESVKAVTQFCLLHVPH